MFVCPSSCSVKCARPCVCMLVRGTPATCGGGAWRLEVDYVMGKGKEEEGWRMVGGCKHSQIS